MSRATFQESIRRSTILPTFTQDLTSVHFRPHADFATLQVFTCDRLNSVLTKESCAANYTRSQAPISCNGCPIGKAHAGGQSYRSESEYAKVDATMGLPCIRCERDAHTANRYIARFRLVDRHTLCINCYNRGAEVRKGMNAKGAMPIKWSILQQATITIEDAAGEWQTLDIGLRSSRGECERYVSRVHPGCVLVEVFMGGAAIPAGVTDPAPADWKGDAVRKQQATTAARKRKPKALRIASDREAFQDEDDCWPSRNAAEVEPIESALDPDSIAAFWDLTADGLPEFVQWLCDDWPTFKRAPEWEPSAADKAILNRGLSDHLVDCAVYGHPKRQAEAAAPSAPVADAVALPEVSDAVVSDSEQPENESEWAGCYIVREGVTTYVTDYAEQRGISDEEAAIVLGMCDPDYLDEPEAAAAPEPEPAPEPVKAEPAPKKLTGKQQRKLEKAQRRAERIQQRRPSAPKQIAVTARAYIEVMFEMGARK
jgi:hypothetical protein